MIRAAGTATLPQPPASARSGRSVAVLFADTSINFCMDTQKTLGAALVAYGYHVSYFPGSDILGDTKRFLESTAAASGGAPILRVIFAWLGHGGKADTHARGFVCDEGGRNIPITSIEAVLNTSLSDDTQKLLILDNCNTDVDGEIPPPVSINPGACL